MLRGPVSSGSHVAWESGKAGDKGGTDEVVTVRHDADLLISWPVCMLSRAGLLPRCPGSQPEQGHDRCVSTGVFPKDSAAWSQPSKNDPQGLWLEGGSVRTPPWHSAEQAWQRSHPHLALEAWPCFSISLPAWARTTSCDLAEAQPLSTVSSYFLVPQLCEVTASSAHSWVKASQLQPAPAACGYDPGREPSQGVAQAPPAAGEGAGVDQEYRVEQVAAQPRQLPGKRRPQQLVQVLGPPAAQNAQGQLLGWWDQGHLWDMLGATQSL